MNSVIVGEAMKLVFKRPRPNAANGGSFGAGGASFPSEHALSAWSIATVIAHEYPGPLTKLLAYGAATGISRECFWVSAAGRNLLDVVEKATIPSRIRRDAGRRPRVAGLAAHPHYGPRMAM